MRAHSVNTGEKETKNLFVQGGGGRCFAGSPTHRILPLSPGLPPTHPVKLELIEGAVGVKHCGSYIILEYRFSEPPTSSQLSMRGYKPWPLNTLPSLPLLMNICQRPQQHYEGTRLELSSHTTAGTCTGAQGVQEPGPCRTSHNVAQSLKCLFPSDTGEICLFFIDPSWSQFLFFPLKICVSE